MPKKKDSLFERGVKLLMERVEFQEDSDEEMGMGGSDEGEGVMLLVFISEYFM